MSSCLIASGYRNYDKPKRRYTVANDDIMMDDEPPSYFAVIAEKYQQQQCTTWGKKLNEINDVLKSMKKSIEDTQLMMKSFHNSCQKLELKNQYLLTKLELEIASISEINDSDTTTTCDKLEQGYDANDSLTRMNKSLEKLIEEAQTSLKTRLSLHADPLRRSRSCPRFTASIDQSSRRKSSGLSAIVDLEEKEKQLEKDRKLQRRRYFHSQWKLAIAMKQFVQTVQSTFAEEKLDIVQVVHHHHHHHHIHHHYHHVIHHYENKAITKIEEVVEKEEEPVEKIMPEPEPAQQPTMLPSSSSLTSLFKYALHTVVGIIPPPSPSLISQTTEKNIASSTTTTLSKSIKIKAMLMATSLILPTLHKKARWIRRANILINRFKDHHPLYTIWTRYSQLLLFILHLISIHHPKN